MDSLNPKTNSFGNNKSQTILVKEFSHLLSFINANIFQCQGLVIQGKVLQPNLTQEMTSGELKFALAVETVLNSIPQPEYRQLVVEALMVITLVVEYKAVNNLGGMITVEHLVHKANQIFLEDQVSFYI